MSLRTPATERQAAIDQECSACRFSHLAPENADAPGVMTCCRFPPAWVITEDTENCRWPYVYPDQWCGEFAAEDRK